MNSNTINFLQFKKLIFRGKKKANYTKKPKSSEVQESNLIISPRPKLANPHHSLSPLVHWVRFLSRDFFYF